MKIFNNPNVTRAMRVYNKTGAFSTKEAKEIMQSKDKIEISQKAKEFQIAMNAFKKLPEVREEKIQAIKEKIQNGTYNVSGKEIADKILESIQIDMKI